MRLGKNQKLILEDWKVGEVRSQNEIFSSLGLHLMGDRSEAERSASSVLRSVDSLCSKGILEWVDVFFWKRLK